MVISSLYTLIHLVLTNYVTLPYEADTIKIFNLSMKKQRQIEVKYIVQDYTSSKEWTQV